MKYDVVFVSNGEDNAEENYQMLAKITPVKRITGVNSIHAAYQAAGEIAETDYVYLVDADNEVTEFDFQKFEYPEKFRSVPHVVTWRTKNRVNSLVYGHGGITLYPTSYLRDTSRAGADVAQGLGIPVRSLCYVGSVHAFDFNEYNTWRTAFREGVKLRRSVERNNCPNAGWRLKVWESEGYGIYGAFSVAGARLGSRFFKDFPDKISMINQEDELRNLFSTMGNVNA